MPKGLLAKVGGILSLLSIIFLPIAGCDQVGITGLEVLRAGDIGILIKALLVISISSAFISLFVKSYITLFACGGVGASGLLISYIMIRQKVPAELKMGAYLALIGFGLIAIEGFLSKQKMEMEANATDNSDP